MDRRAPIADVLVVADGRIADVGHSDLIANYRNARTVDVGGRTVIPGFVDAHHHLSAAALHPLFVDLSHATSTEAIIDSPAET